MDLSLTLHGDASLNAGSAILLDDNFDKGTAGRWIVKRNVHRLGKGGEGFVTELSCERPNDDTTVQGPMNGPVQVAGLKKTAQRQAGPFSALHYNTGVGE